jgi:hypothetical protein
VGESRNAFLVPPAGGSHDQRGPALRTRLGELGGDGERGGRGRLACLSRSPAGAVLIRCIHRRAAGARRDDGRGIRHFPERWQAKGIAAPPVRGAGFWLRSHCGLVRKAFNAPSASVSQAGRSCRWRCHHRALVWHRLDSQADSQAHGRLRTRADDHGLSMLHIEPRWTLMDVRGRQPRGLQDRLRGAVEASWVGSIPIHPRQFSCYATPPAAPALPPGRRLLSQRIRNGASRIRKSTAPVRVAGIRYQGHGPMTSSSVGLPGLLRR